MANTIQFPETVFEVADTNGVVVLTPVEATALTATSTGVDTVDGTYGAPEQAAITTTRTRVDEIEQVLIDLGFLAAPA